MNFFIHQIIIKFNQNLINHFNNMCLNLIINLKYFNLNFLGSIQISAELMDFKCFISFIFYHLVIYTFKSFESYKYKFHHLFDYPNRFNKFNFK